MSSASKRRVSLAWSLPLVVAILILVVVKLMARQRADVIRALDERVAHGSTDEATDAVRNLAMIPRPPLALLVKAAASPNLEVAREAQQAIDEYLKFCQREVKAERNTKLIARQLTVLAEALAIEKHLFSVSDYPWLERTAQKVLRMANRVPSKTTPRVAERCDDVLASVSAGQLPLARAVENLTFVANAAVHEAGTQAGLSSVSKDAAVGPDDATTATAAARSWSEPVLGRNAASEASLPITLEKPNGKTTTAAAAQATADGPQVVEENPHTEVAPPVESGWRAQWTHPILKSLPTPASTAAPSSDSPRSAIGDSASVGAAALHDIETLREPAHLEAPGEQFSSVTSRHLLKRWLAADGSNARTIELELMHRGFGRLARPLVQQLFSEDVEVRLRLVEDVLRNPDVDARPWLLVLADDDDADVRLAAVTIMATSYDPELIEKAWQVVIRDRDPRIAGLAERLRERRSGARRR